MWAKQSTAATLIVGPILDSAGAEYASAVIGDLSISKNGGTLTAMAAAATLTHIANGQYTLVMTTGNLDTLGRAQITCNKSTYQMPPVNLMVAPAMVFDSMVLGTDVMQSDVTQWLGTACAAVSVAGVPEVDVTHWKGTGAATPSIAGVPEVDVTYVNGTAATASSAIDANLTEVLGTGLTEGASGRLAAALIKFLNVTSPTGTVNSLPDAAPDAPGGLPVSDAGGLDLDSKLANTNEVTAARMGALTDWVNGGRLDLLLDAVVATSLLSKQILGNKHTVVEAPTGTFTISVRNDADDATVRTIVYIPATGARTVS